jgi:hypothetical protein
VDFCQVELIPLFSFNRPVLILDRSCVLADLCCEYVFVDNCGCFRICMADCVMGFFLFVHGCLGINFLIMCM